jgi:hypothetical protein
MGPRTRLSLLAALALCTGCHWFQKRPQLEPTPIVFQQMPALEQVYTAVNGNADRVKTLQTRDAKMTVAGVPVGIALDMSYEQPQRLRLRAGTGLTGQELDLGSNDELFWFWARQSPQPALFYARHDQFAASPNRNLIPIEPLWIIDAMGLPRFDPSQRHEGPLSRGNGMLEVRSHIPASDGERTKITLIDLQHAWVMEQQVYDARGRLLAAAQASEHEFFPQAAVALPRKVAIQLPGAQLSFTVETKGYSLNFPLENSGDLFALPREQLPNAPLVDLADPRLSPPAESQLPAGYPTTTEQPRLRGLR